MHHDRRLSAKEIFLEVQAQPEAERGGWLQDRCAGDPDLMQAVQNLLAEHDPTEVTARTDAASDADTGSAAPLEVVPGRRIGAWRLLKPLGAGGMGFVWLAERADSAFQMTAAVKLLKGAPFSQQAIQRFKRERQLLADLKHPNICILHDGGATPEGLPYLVMEHVEGDTIDRWCLQHKAGTADVLQLFRQLCEAVAYAHRKGILHRDLKPANVMVTQEGFVKLMDFGIAGWATDDDGEALTGAFAPMTPEYASPEQLRGGEVTPASDVYALGLILFQLLSGKRPREAHGQFVAILYNQAGERGDALMKIS
ncbi:MAG: serine/threonine-protein kinase [Acidobacteriota bacterium]|nr:serine/threonine-protein kinase [Acidobacteriota bacterium]